jgi:hypothetical protein
MLKLDGEQRAIFIEAFRQLMSLFADVEKFHAKVSGKAMILEEKFRSIIDPEKESKKGE